MSTAILCETSDAIATITLNRPERRNAVTFEMWHHMQRLLVDLKAAPQVRVIVFRGAGDEAFSAGADISEFETHRNNAAKATLYNPPLMRRWTRREVGKPTSVPSRACVGGGCEFTTACDIRIAAENARPVCLLPALAYPVGFRKMRLVRLIGRPRPWNLLTADLLSAPKHRLGSSTTSPLADVEAFTYAMASKIAACPGRT
jgi:enoyl-CoA hydratase/carnithine racemase